MSRTILNDDVILSYQDVIFYLKQYAMLTNASLCDEKLSKLQKQRKHEIILAVKAFTNAVDRGLK